MILITGHRGLIGSKLSQRAEEGVDFIGIDIKDGHNLLTCELPNVEFSTIYHLAAQTSVESSWNDPLHDLDNIRMTARLVHTYPNSKIIYANSAASIDPKSPYGFSKKACADYLKLFHKNYVSLIFPNIYGEGSKSVVDIFKGKDEVTVYGDGLQTRDYVHVDDIVEGLLLAQKWPVGEYEMGSGISTTVLDLTRGKRVNFAPERKEARDSVLRNTTPEGQWKPKIKVEDYL